jgi:hypothetical protein
MVIISHQFRFHLTRIDRVKLEEVNRPVPCEHKGTREFPRHSAASRIALNLQGVAGSNPVSQTQPNVPKLKGPGLFGSEI